MTVCPGPLAGQGGCPSSSHQDCVPAGGTGKGRGRRARSSRGSWSAAVHTTPLTLHRPGLCHRGDHAGKCLFRHQLVWLTVRAPVNTDSNSPGFRSAWAAQSDAHGALRTGGGACPVGPRVPGTSTPSARGLHSAAGSFAVRREIKTGVTRFLPVVFL